MTKTRILIPLPKSPTTEQIHTILCESIVYFSKMKIIITQISLPTAIYNLIHGELTHYNTITILPSTTITESIEIQIVC